MQRERNALLNLADMGVGRVALLRRLVASGERGGLVWGGRGSEGGGLGALLGLLLLGRLGLGRDRRVLDGGGRHCVYVVGGLSSLREQLVVIARCEGCLDCSGDKAPTGVFGDDALCGVVVLDCWCGEVIPARVVDVLGGCGFVISKMQKRKNSRRSFTTKGLVVTVCFVVWRKEGGRDGKAAGQLSC